MDYFAALYKIYFLDLSFVRIIWWEQNDVLFGRLSSTSTSCGAGLKIKIKLNNKICLIDISRNELNLKSSYWITTFFFKSLSFVKFRII